jgi:hypothetical protein
MEAISNTVFEICKIAVLISCTIFSVVIMSALILMGIKEITHIFKEKKN